MPCTLTCTCSATKECNRLERERERDWGGGGREHLKREIERERAGIAQLVVLGLAVHSVAGSILLWGHFR